MEREEVGDGGGFGRGAPSPCPRTGAPAERGGYIGTVWPPFPAPLRGYRSVAALIVAAALAVQAQLRVIFPEEARATTASAVQGATVEKNEIRFQPVRSLIPPGAVIGYASADDMEYRNFGRTMAQYVLAPVLLDDSARHEYVLANCYGSYGRNVPLVLPGFVAVWNSGNGVVLFKERSDK